MATDFRLDNAPLIALDTETTGLDFENDRIIEIGCVRMRGRIYGDNPEDHYQRYVNPEQVVADEVIDVHKITNEMLAKEKTFREIADEFIEFVRDSHLLIHNAAFDVTFLNKELERAGKEPLEHYVAHITDTMLLAKKLYPGRIVTLDNLGNIVQVDFAERDKGHGAYVDAKLLAQTYLAMTRGQNKIELDMGYDPMKFGPIPDEIPIRRANAEELAAHEKKLDEVDKACGARCDWRRLGAAPDAEDAEDAK